MLIRGANSDNKTAWISVAGDVADIDSITYLSLLLWSDHNYEELKSEISQYIQSEDAGIFLHFEGKNANAFAHCQLRYDYVEGTDSSPVAYLEAIFVKAEHRNKGIARSLLDCCEKWAKERGCSEFASDCAIDNNSSFKFHLKTGFIEANKIICFTKRL